MTTQEERIQDLSQSLSDYKNFVSEISEGVWRIELREPIAATLPAEEQIELCFKHAFMAECNAAMAKMYGFENSDGLLGTPLREILIPEDPKNREMLYAFVQSGYRLQNAESVECDRNGSICYFVNNLVGIVHDGKLTGAWGTQRDITEYRALESNLKAAAEEAGEASRAKSRFLANVSHEIRTPLGVILGFADLALDTQDLPKDARGYIQAIRRNGRQLAELLGEVLDMSKIEASRMEIENIRFALGPFLKEIVASMGVNAREKGLLLNVERQGPLPKHVKTDPTKLRQVLVNLLSNAIKFTDQGNITLGVRMKSDAAAGIPVELEFSVKDTGIGISEEMKERLFQPFAQAEASTSRKYGGTGLGLSLSRELASVLGGSLWLSESAAGKGSTFVFCIRCGEMESEIVMPSMEIPFETEGAFHLRGKKVLVVEDSEDNQILISRFLSAAGVLVDLARDGQDGIAKATSHDYDLVVMDIQMPGMDGHEAARILRSGGYAKPIIALTAHAFKEDRERALANGFSEYLTKPINRSVLLRTLDQKLLH
jgi:signal transduction histidine kinase